MDLRLFAFLNLIFTCFQATLYDEVAESAAETANDAVLATNQKVCNFCN
jgi:hypothetical protein